MENTTLLRNGQIISRSCEKADLLIQNGRIAKIAPRLDVPADTTIDLDGLVLAPGFVDLHVHLREPGFSEKETVRTGTMAAAAGGFTTVCAMPNLNPVPDNGTHLAAELEAIAAQAVIEVLPYGAITMGEQGQMLAVLKEMAPHVIGFSDDGKGVQSLAMMYEAMQRIAGLGKLLAAHCEDERELVSGGSVHSGAAAARFGVPGVNSASEWKQIARDIALVRETGVRYHVCHVSAKESIAILRDAKAEGLPVSCECTPHQLALCDEDITEDDGRFKMNPPLRTREDREALIEGLLDGTIDCIATDHAPHTAQEKSRGLAGSNFGVVGLETAFAACYTALVKSNRCTLPFLIEKLTTAPARLIGRSAVITEGAPANLTALDTQATWQVDPDKFLSMGRSTPFAGQTLHGQVAATWYLGTQIYKKGLAE